MAKVNCMLKQQLKMNNHRSRHIHNLKQALQRKAKIESNLCSKIRDIKPRGRGNKQSARHHPPTLKRSLRASRICYYFFQGGVGKEVMRYQS